MRISFCSLIPFGVAINQVIGAPVLSPFPVNLAIYYPLQYFFGTAFKDFHDLLQPNELSELIDRMDPALNLEKNVHHPHYGGKTPGGFSAVSNALDESAPALAGPAHQTLKTLREETIASRKETAT